MVRSLVTFARSDCSCSPFSRRDPFLRADVECDFMRKFDSITISTVRFDTVSLSVS